MDYDRLRQLWLLLCHPLSPAATKIEDSLAAEGSLDQSMISDHPQHNLHPHLIQTHILPHLVLPVHYPDNRYQHPTTERWPKMANTDPTCLVTRNVIRQHPTATGVPPRWGDSTHSHVLSFSFFESWERFDRQVGDVSNLASGDKAQNTSKATRWRSEAGGRGGLSQRRVKASLMDREKPRARHDLHQSSRLIYRSQGFFRRIKHRIGDSSDLECRRICIRSLKAHSHCISVCVI